MVLFCLSQNQLLNIYQQTTGKVNVDWDYENMAILRKEACLNNDDEDSIAVIERVGVAGVVTVMAGLVVVVI